MLCTSTTEAGWATCSALTVKALQFVFAFSLAETYLYGVNADDIGQGSPLEMCYYLGKLQEDNYLLSKAPKKKGEVDVMIKVPC